MFLPSWNITISPFLQTQINAIVDTLALKLNRVSKRGPTLMYLLCRGPTGRHEITHYHIFSFAAVDFLDFFCEATTRPNPLESRFQAF